MTSSSFSFKPFSSHHLMHTAVERTCAKFHIVILNEIEDRAEKFELSHSPILTSLIYCRVYSEIREFSMKEFEFSAV